MCRVHSGMVGGSDCGYINVVNKNPTYGRWWRESVTRKIDAGQPVVYDCQCFPSCKCQNILLTPVTVAKVTCSDSRLLGAWIYSSAEEEAAGNGWPFRAGEYVCEAGLVLKFNITEAHNFWYIMC